MAELSAALGGARDKPSSLARPAARQIDAVRGLRALAVLSVVLFHVDPKWLPGGFVGVDVFFTISGFVVAHSVFGVEKARFRDYFLWFYRRRFLRILPAIYLYVLVIATLGALFIPASEVSKYIEVTGAASLFGASNFALLWKAGDYFAASSEYNTFTHTWSLAVEEQYYFLFPLFSWLMIVKRGANAYMLPTRLWELGLGFMLRYLCAPGENAPSRSVLSTVAGLAALAALLASFWFTSPAHFPFPGAVLPCLATAALLAMAWLAPGGAIDGALRLRPLAYLGDISYSLYLWHWGVVVLMRWTVGLDSPPLKLFALGLTLALAAASYHLVERPLRYDKRLLALGTPAFFAAYAAAGALIAAACLGLMLTKPRIGLAASNDAALWSPYITPVRPGECPVTRGVTAVSGGLLVSMSPACGIADPHRLFVMGDSHAGAYERMLHRTVSASRGEVRLYTMGGCHLLDVDERPLVPGCAAFRAAVTRQILAAARAGDTLFLPALYTPRYRDIWGVEGVTNAAIDRRPLAASARAIGASVAALRVFQQHGIAIVIEAPKPTIPTAPFRCVDWFDRGSRYCSAGWMVPRAEMERRRARPLAALRRIADDVPGALLWDPFPLLCPAATCGAFMGDKPLYYDTDHLSGFANDLLLPSFTAAVAETRPVPADRATPTDRGKD